MRRQTILQAVGPLLIVVLGITAFLWLKSMDRQPTTSAGSTPPPLVRTRALGPPRDQFEITIGGRVVPSREVTISAEVSGRIVARPDALRAGRHVTQGTLLVQLDPTDHELILQEVTSQLDGVDLELKQLDVAARGLQELTLLAEEDVQLASKELQRIVSLLESKAAAPAERDRAARDLLDARIARGELGNQQDLLPAQRERFDARRRGLIARQRRARRDLARTRIIAPFSGLLAFENVEVGDFVRTGDVLLKLERAEEVEVECQLRADHLRWLRDSLDAATTSRPEASSFEVPVVPVTISYRGSPGQWTGRLTRFQGDGVDPQTRTIACRVLVERQRPAATTSGRIALIRGMYVTVTLPVRLQTPLIEIPAEAVRPDGQVWSVRSDRLIVHRILIARTLQNSVLVKAELTNLKPADPVVISPLAIAYEGMPVETAPVSETDDAGEAPTP